LLPVRSLPEISGDVPDEADDLNLVDPFLEPGTRNSKLSSPPPPAPPGPDLTIADLPPRTEKYRKINAKLAAKSARKTLLCAKKSQENHKDTPSEKKLAKNPETGPETAASPAVWH